MGLAQELGIGQRSGFVETYLIHATNPHLGQRVTEHRYLVVDERNPWIQGGRLFGDENEEYLWRERLHGLPGTSPYRFHNSMLRFLQMRRNYLYTHSETPDPELLHYVLLTMGKGIDGTPDAWCALRESHLSQFHVYGTEGPMKNLERWLHQRDRPGFETVAVEPMPNPVRNLWLAEKSLSLIHI